MNSDKVQAALALLQEAIDDRSTTVTLNLELNAREADLLLRICIANVSVPATVVKALPTYFGKDPGAEQEITDLLNKIHLELP